MKISTKGRYALRFLLDLAEHQNDGFIALKDVAVRQKISKKYLEQIIPILNKSQLLYANRGYQGGYKLVKPANQYTVGEILRLTEGSIAPVACLDFDPARLAGAAQGDLRLPRQHHAAGYPQQPQRGFRQLCDLTHTQKRSRHAAPFVFLLFTDARSLFGVAVVHIP